MKEKIILIGLALLSLSACGPVYESPKVSGWRTEIKAKDNDQSLNMDISACQYEVQKMAYGTAMPNSSLGIGMMAAQLDSMRLSCMRAKGWEPVWQ